MGDRTSIRCNLCVAGARDVTIEVFCNGKENVLTFTDWVSLFTVWTLYTAFTIILCVGVALLIIATVRRIGVVLKKSMRADPAQR